jgi:hypothetical protein
MLFSFFSAKGIGRKYKDCKRHWPKIQRLRKRHWPKIQRLQKALAKNTKKLASMIDEDWEDLDARALSTIRLCLTDQVFFNNTKEDTTIGLWNRLESLYMTKSLIDIIFLKRPFYNLWMKEGPKNC